MIKNVDIIQAYKAENGIPLDTPLFTFAAWKAKGFKVKAGEHAKYHVTMWKHAEYTKEVNGEIVKASRCFQKTAHLFEAGQVERMK